MIYSCCSDNRKATVLNNPKLNGIDYLEVLPNDDLPQQTLLLHCLKTAPSNLKVTNILITGGESITGITVLWVAPATPPPAQATIFEKGYLSKLADVSNTLVIRTSQAGDFSPYTLRLVNDSTGASEDSFEVTEVLDEFDPQLSAVQFSFKVECGPNFDCPPAPCDCPPEAATPPAINYLAKDYGSFRGVMLDRMNQLLPNWKATSEADLGIALAELISYVGDHLSYRQDAVATEAYLRTAQSRISLRRHALLVDYHIHDGCNSRAWIQLQVKAQFTLDRTKTRFYTFAPDMPSSVAVGLGNEETALVSGVIVFEPMQNMTLYPENNAFDFYTWGDTNCCLPTGATEATLLDTQSKLQPGDVLIFQEMIGPQTGNPADADIRHRCAVRLTAVATKDTHGNILADPLFEDGTGKPITKRRQKPTPVTEIQWSADDALPFAVCISSSYIDSNGNQQNLTKVSQAFGNVVLADQGLSFTGKQLPSVPQPSMFVPPNPAGNRCAPSAAVPLPVRYRPQIPDSPVTQAVPLPLAGTPITPDPVALPLTGYAALTDSNGNICLTFAADDPASWPQYFGIMANPNAVHAGNFDLALVFAPPGAAAPVVVESYPNLSDPAHAKQQINSLSKFVSVPADDIPPGAAPADFPAGPTMLANSGIVNIDDAHGTTYLEVQAVNPATWPPSFGVLVEGDIQNPDSFNFLVLYSPGSGVGIPVPAVVEEFGNVTLGNIASHFTSSAQLISVRSFGDEPTLSFSATDLMNYDAKQAIPLITLKSLFKSVHATWTAQPDLLGDGPTDTNFVVEVECNGVALLRFGDNTNGMRPDPGMEFTASYRIGNGTPGNVGANTLNLFAGDPRILSCTNPLPASGGVDMETNDQIRRRVPVAFMTQERAVTMPDYEAVTEMNTQVENAVATLRWTGSWYTVFITAEPQTGGNLTRALQKALLNNINRYRLAGQDLQLESPQYVPLQIALTICVDPDYFQSDVRQALMQVLGSGILPNGRKGLFYPDNFTFGQTFYLSPIYAAARTVAGVQSVTATIFAPQGVTTNLYLSQGEIPFGPFQIARMDNDPGFPNHGQLTLTLEGGK